MNQEKIEKLWKEMLIEIGENPEREGLKDTPKRIANMYKEIFRGYDKSQLPKVTVFPNGQDGIKYTQMITDSGKFYSQCEHHNRSFFGTYYFAYIPSGEGNILGISKVARVVDYFSAKLQIQERLTQEIINHLWEILSKNSVPPIGMALIMKAQHLCKISRGVKKEGWMTTSDLKGEFLIPTKGNPMQEFLSLIKLNGDSL